MGCASSGGHDGNHDTDGWTNTAVAEDIRKGDCRKQLPLLPCAGIPDAAPLSTMIGPTPTSNWLVPGKVTASIIDIGTEVTVPHMATHNAFAAVDSGICST